MLIFLVLFLLPLIFLFLRPSPSCCCCSSSSSSSSFPIFLLLDYSPRLSTNTSFNLFVRVPLSVRHPCSWYNGQRDDHCKCHIRIMSDATPDSVKQKFSTQCARLGEGHNVRCGGRASPLSSPLLARGLRIHSPGASRLATPSLGTSVPREVGKPQPPQPRAFICPD